DTTRLLTDTLEKKLQETAWLVYLVRESRAGRTGNYVKLREQNPPHTVPPIWYKSRHKKHEIYKYHPHPDKGTVCILYTPQY
ncbi:hypothetical protein, partial [Enterobacter mori]